MERVQVKTFKEIILENFTEEETVEMAMRIQSEHDHRRLFDVLATIIDTALANGISMETIQSVLGIHKESLDELLEEENETNE